MKNLEQTKQSQFNIVFFTIKILALFFCAAPLFQFFFKDNTEGTLENINFAAIIISLVIISIITFMWVIMDYNRRKMKFATLIEIVVFFGVCFASIMISGAFASYYKFLFIFLVVSYTIEAGIKTGLAIAFASSAVILMLDTVQYNPQGVNLYFQADIALSAMYIVIAWILGFYTRLERQHINELQLYVNLDGLTGVYNHRYFHEQLKINCEESNNNNQPLSLIMMDIDYFKIYNDIHGHQQGDNALKQVATIIKEQLRSADIVCRYGGDEFAIILPKTDRETAIDVANGLRQYVADYDFPGVELLPDHAFTISLGVAEFKGEADSAMDLINRADSALYRAKFFRRNRVELYTSVFDQFKSLNQLSGAGMTSVKSLITIINSRDSYTYNHTERVVLYCQIFADYVGLADNEKMLLIYGAYLHDIGKINVSKEALISDKPLTAEEWEEMKKHPVDSAEIIKQMDGLGGVVDIVLQHHEKYDGSGYPDGLKGEEIHPLARVLTLADSFDAMTASRPYQKARTREEAYEEIRRCAGTHFDPSLTELFISAIRKAL
jgi:diguanylate cyclase (GGDEF)-like protein/putative nucleotidyltransferase with HDIG domain